MTLTRVPAYRPNRNYVRLGDQVQVTRSREGKKDGFKARVLRIDADESGKVVQVDVVALTGKYAGKIRTLRPERLTRLAQTVNGKKKR